MQATQQVRIRSHDNACSATFVILHLQESVRRLGEEQRAREAAQVAQQVCICSHGNVYLTTSVVLHLQELERKLGEERRAREAAQAAQQVRMLYDSMAFVQ